MFLCTRLVTDVPDLSVAPLASISYQAECEFLSGGPPPLLQGGPKLRRGPPILATPMRARGECEDSPGVP